LFYVHRHSSEAALAEGYFGGILISQQGYFRKRDFGARKTKAKEKAYRMSDGEGLYLWVTPAGGKLWRWGIPV
jgi:hypothetical protein